MLRGCGVAAVWLSIRNDCENHKQNTLWPICLVILMFPPSLSCLPLHLLPYSSLDLFLFYLSVYLSCRKARFSSAPSSTVFAWVPSQRWDLRKDNFLASVSTAFTLSVSCSHSGTPGKIWGDCHVRRVIHALINHSYSVFYRSTDWSGTLSWVLLAELFSQVPDSPGALAEHKHEIFNSSIFIQPWLGLAAGCIWNSFFFLEPLCLSFWPREE